MSFTWIDWLIAGVIVISALVSLRRGFFREVLSLVTWIAAVFVAWSFGGALAVHLTPYFETPSVRAMVAYALLFVATLFVGALVSRLIGSLIK